MSCTLVAEIDGDGARVPKRTLTGTEYVVPYVVVFDTIPSNQEDILNADDGTTALPIIGDQYPNRTGEPKAYCYTLDVSQVDGSRRHYWVTARYQTNETLINMVPTDDPWDISIGHREYQYQVDKEVFDAGGIVDENGDLIIRTLGLDNIVNSAGEEFDEPLVETGHYPTISLSRNMSEVDWTTIADRIDCINDAAITIAGKSWPKYSLRLIDAPCSGKLYRNGNGYYRQSYVLWYKKDLWIRLVKDLGFMRIVDGKVSKITIDGVQPSKPQQLDGQGGFDPTVAPADRIIAFHQFGTLQPIDFSVFEFPAKADTDDLTDRERRKAEASD